MKNNGTVSEAFETVPLNLKLKIAELPHNEFLMVLLVEDVWGNGIDFRETGN